MPQTVKYKVTLNWSGENHVFYSHAENKHRALRNAQNHLAQNLSVTPAFVILKTGSLENENARVEIIIPSKRKELNSETL